VALPEVTNFPLASFSASRIFTTFDAGVKPGCKHDILGPFSMLPREGRNLCLRGFHTERAFLCPRNANRITSPTANTAFRLEKHGEWIKNRLT